MSITSDVGVIVAYTNKLDIPINYLICDGREVSRSTYNMLFNVIGESFGRGDGVSTFCLPDLRGMFVRGLDSGSGNDPEVSMRTAVREGANFGDNVGSFQPDSFKRHTHEINMTWDHGDSAYSISSSTRGSDPYFSSPALTSEGDGAETRPKNIALVYIIKFLPDSSLSPSNIKCKVTLNNPTQSFISNVIQSVILETNGVIKVDPYNMVDDVYKTRIVAPYTGIYQASLSGSVIGDSSRDCRYLGLSIIDSSSGLPVVNTPPSYNPSINNLLFRMTQGSSIEVGVMLPFMYNKLQYLSVSVELVELGSEG